MADQIRRVDQYSPKTSPRGGRSPVVPRQDSTGTLKTTISLGKTPSIVHSGPFYLLKKLPPESDKTGQDNLVAKEGLEHSYNKFCGKKLKESLSSFLPNLPGSIDTPGHQDNSSLRSLIDKPPIGGKEIVQLTPAQLSGFRLHPGPLPEYQYRFLNQSPTKRKHKHKKHRHRLGGGLSGDTPTQGDTPVHGQDSDQHEKKHKKQKRHDEDRKKKKKEKKKKKQKHSPEHPNSGSSQHDPNAKVLGKL